jgi:hypothetical protein
MNLKELIMLLDEHKDAALYIMLPTGDFVPEHFHITEVGRVQKDFIDCGGTVRKNVFCSLQAWCAHDVEHRLVAGKLAKILKLGEKVLGTDDLSVEVEYGADVVSHYVLADVEVTPKGLLFMLVGKQTDCLAPDKCGVTEKCCVGSGCC